MAMQQLSFKEKHRILKAQSARFDWTKLNGSSKGFGDLHRVVEAHAQAVGTPKEFFFMPLLTVAASFMGINAVVQINPEWLEPAIIWTVVAARKGEKKTAALNRILAAVEEVEEEVAKKKANDTERPQLAVQHFSMEALHRTMLNNGCQILGLYDEMSIMYGQLDAYKRSGSTLDRSTLLGLYNGGSWARNFKNQSGPSKMLKTAFNMSGFIQPAFIISKLNKCETDGFSDRQLFDCPPEVDYKYNDFKIPMESSIPPLSLIFKLIHTAHQKSITYTMCDEAKEAFIQYYDNLVERRQAVPDDENRRGVLGKAQGQCARLSMILHVLGQAVAAAFELHHEQKYTAAAIEDKCSSWSKKISAEAVQFAKILTDHFINQKFTLMPATAEVVDPQVQLGEHGLLADYPKQLKKFLTYQAPFTASVACRMRLIPPTPQRSGKTFYPVEWAKQFMEEVAKAGFGSVECVRSGSKSSHTFRKRKYDELEKPQLETLKKLKILHEDYESGDSQTSGSSSSVSNGDATN